MLKTDDNVEGVPGKNGMVEKFQKTACISCCLWKTFYGVSMINQSVSKPILKWNQMLCLNSSAKATDCVRSFSETDFRNDLKSTFLC
jgi:peroxiredoxin